MNRWYLRLVDKMVQASDCEVGMGYEEKKPLFPNPYITVARDPGSGGKPIAELLAKKLKYEFYDDQFVEEVAKSAKLRAEILAEVDERSRTQIEDLIHNILNPEYVSERRYIKHLCKVVLHRAQKGRVVFLGRGSNFITPFAHGLHVRITAPYRVCVARAVQFEGVTHAKARKIIKKVAQERSAFVKQYFGKNKNNSKYYDLTLNTTFMSLDDAAEVILKALRMKFPKIKL